mgnify:CR=1 FL=1
MQTIYTLSAYETTAAAFFQRLREMHTDLVLDIRLNNQSQLCGFTKEKDLAFFVPQLTGAKYQHDLTLAPTKELLDMYTKKIIGWDAYRDEYLTLLEARHGKAHYPQQNPPFSRRRPLRTPTKKRRSHSEALYQVLQS